MNPLSVDFSARGTKLVLRLAAALLLLAGALAVLATPSAVMAQPEVTDTTFTSEQFEFELTWDDSWTIVEQNLVSEAGSFERIDIVSGQGYLSIILVFRDDPQGALDIALESTMESGSDHDVIGTEEGDDFLSTTVDFTFTNEEGQDFFYRKYHEVHPIEPARGNDPALFVGTFLGTAEVYDDEWANLNATVERDGRDPVFRGTPEGIRRGGGDDDDRPVGDDDDQGTAGIDGNAFVGAVTGVSVEWDDRTWEAEDASTRRADRLILTSDVGEIDISTLAGDDVRSCVTDNAGVLNEEGFEEVERARNIEAPQAPDDAYSRTYQYVDTSGSRDRAYLHYFECRVIDDETLLLIGFRAESDEFEDAVADVQEVLDSIQIGAVPSGDDDDAAAGEPELTETSYTGGQFNWTVEFDDRVWQASLLEGDPGYEGVALDAEFGSLWIEAFTALDGDPDECLDATAANLADAENVSDVEEEDRLDPPETVRGASAALYAYVFTNDDGDEFDNLEYIECRVLVEGETFLRVTLVTSRSSWRDALPELEAVLAAIDIGAEPAGGDEPADDDRGTDEPSTNGEQPGVDGRAYESPLFPFTLEWNRTWDVLRATAEDEVTTLTLSNGTSTVIVMAGAFEPVPTDCVDGFAALQAGQDGVTEYNFAVNEEGETQAGGNDEAAFALYVYAMDGDDFFDYISCDVAPGSDYIVAVIATIPAAEFASQFTEVQELLQNLVIS